jgi:hypothetical protein
MMVPPPGGTCGEVPAVNGPKSGVQVGACQGLGAAGPVAVEWNRFGEEKTASETGVGWSDGGTRAAACWAARGAGVWKGATGLEFRSG